MPVTGACALSQALERRKMVRERRAHRRHKVSKHGVIMTEGVAFACRLLDLSEGGARLQVERPVFLDRFRLFYDRVDQQWLEAVAASCVVVRRSADQLGVQFLR